MKKSIKNVVCLILLVALTLTMAAGCGKNKSDDDFGPATQTVTVQNTAADVTYDIGFYDDELDTFSELYGENVDNKNASYAVAESTYVTLIVSNPEAAVEIAGADKKENSGNGRYGFKIGSAAVAVTISLEGEQAPEEEQEPADEESKTPETQEPVKTPETEQKPGENTTQDPDTSKPEENENPKEEQKPGNEPEKDEQQTPTDDKKEDTEENKAPVMVPVYLKVNNCTNFSITVNGDTYTQNDLVFTGNADYNSYETNFTFVQNSTISVVINSGENLELFSIDKSDGNTGDISISGDKRSATFTMTGTEATITLAVPETNEGTEIIP